MAKSVAAGADPVVPGTKLTYTVTGTNVGDGDYTAEEPAVLVDDLSDVLDDATFGEVSASVGTVTRVGDKIVWSGPLAAGAKVTITYTVTATADGDGKSVNVAFTTDDPIDPDSGLPTDPETGEPTTTPTECVEPLCATTSTDITTPGTPDPDPTPEKVKRGGPLADTGGPALWALLAGLIAATAGAVLIGRARK